jgi:fructose-bisphosphate aldolase class II
LKTQIGNPEGSDVPNKKYYDPRKWMRESEMTFNARLEQAFADLNNVNTYKIRIMSYKVDILSIL